MTSMPWRTVNADGSVELHGQKCTFSYTRPYAGIVVMRIVGADLGDLGLLPMEELRKDLQGKTPIDLFIDASGVTRAVVPVQQDWTAWLTASQAQLRVVHMLVQSHFMSFTVELVKFFSRTGELLHVHTEPEPYATALERAVARRQARPG